MTTPPVDLGGLTIPDLRRAVALYLDAAYAGVDPPPAVKRRLEWSEDATAAGLVAAPPFEKAGKPGGPPIYALRLGNARYPHMKLQVQPWPCPEGYLLSVNTHDQILGLDPDAPDSSAFRELQAENARLKDAIEAAWGEAGLPTFLHYLRDYLDSHPSGI